MSILYFIVNFKFLKTKQKSIFSKLFLFLKILKTTPVFTIKVEANILCFQFFWKYFKTLVPLETFELLSPSLRYQEFIARRGVHQ